MKGAVASNREASNRLQRALPGVASDFPVTVRALAYIIVGHERHHLGVLKERYLV